MPPSMDFNETESSYSEALDSFLDQAQLDAVDDDETWYSSASEEDNATSLQTTEPSAKTPQAVLEKYWGYSSFREKQLDIITSVLEGRDTLGLLPTGGGKSITFQVPGLLLPEVTLVITPLIALMKDQVESLRRCGIKAAALHAGIPNYKIKTVLNNAVFGGVKFLYISPERISSPAFKDTLRYLKVSLIVVDECHCVSQWGYDFRPSYLNIASLRTLYPAVPILALTATATPLVKEDIVRELKLRTPRIIQKSFARDNLTYVVRHCQDKEAMILKILSSVGGSAIVYCRNRKRTAEIAAILRKSGITADCYHAGLSHAERDEKQKAWMQDEVRVMVATNAFGMGIDKPDVRIVIHWAMPSSLEEYYQEAGRGGRDGLPAYAVALVGSHDKAIISRRVEEEFPPLSFVRDFYDLLMSYLQVGDSDGLGRRFKLDFEAFLLLFKLPPTYSFSALRLLEMAGVFQFEEKSSRASRIKIVMPRDALYGLETLRGKREKVVEYMLRKYSGLFTDFVFIEEEAIAIGTRLTLDEVYETLVDLSRLRIVNYIPRSAEPVLTLMTKREPGRLLNIPPEVYQHRKERLKDRIQAVLSYLYNEPQGCRENRLLAYFGETKTEPCGRCDVCRERAKQDAKRKPSFQIAKAVLDSQLKDNDLSLTALRTIIDTLVREQGGSKEEWAVLFEEVVSSSRDYVVTDDVLHKRIK